MEVTLKYAGGYGEKTVTVPGLFTSLAAMKTANRSRREKGLQGGEYWGKAEVRFFDSKPSSRIVEGRLAIDSRQFHASDGSSGPREWSVCCVSDDGDVDKVAFLETGGRLEVKDGNGMVDEFLSEHAARMTLSRMLKNKMETAKMPRALALTPEEFEALGYILDLAHGDQEASLSNGSPTVDYGDEWPFTAAFKAQSFRAIGALTAKLGMHGEPERWEALAVSVEETLADEGEVSQ